MIIELLILTMGTTNIEFYNVNALTVLDTIRLLEEHEDLLGYTKTIKFYGEEHNFKTGGYASYSKEGFCSYIWIDNINNIEPIEKEEFILVHELSHCLLHSNGIKTNETLTNEVAIDILKRAIFSENMTGLR